MGDRWPVVLLVRLLCEHRKHKVPRLALTLPHQEAAGTTLFQQQLLSLLARQVPMVPPDPGQEVGAHVRLGVTAWPGEGAHTHTQPEGSQTDPHRHQGRRQQPAQAVQLAPPTSLTRPSPRARGRSNTRALQGPGWPPGGSLVLSEEGSGPVQLPQASALQLGKLSLEEPAYPTSPASRAGVGWLQDYCPTQTPASGAWDLEEMMPGPQGRTVQDTQKPPRRRRPLTVRTWGPGSPAGAEARPGPRCAPGAAPPAGRCSAAPAPPASRTSPHHTDRNSHQCSGS